MEEITKNYVHAVIESAKMRITSAFEIVLDMDGPILVRFFCYVFFFIVFCHRAVGFFFVVLYVFLPVFRARIILIPAFLCVHVSCFVFDHFLSAPFFLAFICACAKYFILF